MESKQSSPLMKVVQWLLAALLFLAVFLVGTLVFIQLSRPAKPPVLMPEQQQRIMTCVVNGTLTAKPIILVCKSRE